MSNHKVINSDLESRSEQPQGEATLSELLKSARKHTMTPEEKEAQRQSWVRGEAGLDHPGDYGSTSQRVRQEREARARAEKALREIVEALNGQSSELLIGFKNGDSKPMLKVAKAIDKALVLASLKSSEGAK